MDKAKITLVVEEVAEGVLPPICLICGSREVTFQPILFKWITPKTFFLLPLGLLPFAIVRTFLCWSQLVHTPVCKTHQSYWKKRSLVLPLGLLLAVFCYFGAIVMMMVVEHNSLTRLVFIMLMVLSLALVVFSFLIWFVLHFVGTRVCSIAQNEITFQDVDPQFVAAVEQGRKEYQQQVNEWSSQRFGT